MKVIQISTFYKPSIGGVERQVEEISQHLFESGIEVEVFTTDASHSNKKRIPKEELNFKSFFQVRRFKYWIGFGYFFRFSPVLLFKLLFSKFDVIHIHNAHDAHFIGAIIIKILRGKKLVITGHNPYIVTNEKRGENLSKLVSFYEFFFRIFLKFADSYVALLKSERKYVKEYFGMDYEKIFIIPNGIQDIYFEKSEKSKLTNFNKWNLNRNKWKLVVGCVCRMDYVKGIQNLKYSADNLKNVLFIFVGGDGGYLNELMSLYKTNDNVFFTQRYLPTNEVKEFYNEIDLFLLPSIYEPFGITLVEAMTQGKYILASKNGGAREIITDEFGELLNPSDQKAWYESINSALKNKEKIIEKGKTGIKFAQQYKWENVIEKLIRVYNN